MVALVAACAFGQQVAVAPAFDVVSVKPSGPDTRGSSVRFLPGGRFEVRNSPLIAVLEQAYDVTEFQIAEAPGWMTDARAARFNIEAKPPSGNIDAAQLKLMVQALLADRFRLRVHHETRPVPVYALLPGKNGVRLKPVQDGSNPTFDFAPQGGNLRGTNAGMAGFIKVLQRWLDRPVVDKTGFTESFDVMLSWAPGPENTRFALPLAPDSDDNRPDIFAAIQAQLGLRLNAERDPLDVIVVDHVERPSSN